MKNSKIKKENLDKNNKNIKTKYETNSFLELIKKSIDKIKSTKTKKYSLSSCIFLCFYEKKKKTLDKKEICDFIKKEISENNNRIVNSHLKTNQSKIHLVTQKNYSIKLYHILLKSKCFTKVINMETNKEEQIELNEEYIHHRKNIIYKHIFGRKFNSEKYPTNKKVLKLKGLNAIKPKKNNNRKKNDISNDKTKDNNHKDEDKVKVKKKEIEKNKKDSNKHNNIKEKENAPSNIKKLLRKKRKRTNNRKDNNNYLVMPLFAYNDLKNKIEIKKEDNIQKDIINLEEEKEEIISTSFKEIKNIVKAGEEFIIFLKTEKFLNFIKDNDNKKNDIQKLFDSENDELLHSFIKIAMEYYLKFNELIDYFLNDKENNFDSEDEIDNKKSNIVNYFNKKKNYCILLIFRIISKLFSFILEFNFIAEIIDEISNYNKNSDDTKYILEIIEKNKIILNKENIKLFEKMLKNELKNATNSFMIKKGIHD